MRYLLLAGLAGLLTGCGFHLRGQGDATTFAFASLHIAAPPGGVADPLRRQLALRQDVALLPPDQAEVVLSIDGESVDKQILSVNRSGRVSEYQLTYRLRFALSRQGREWLYPTPLTLRRDYSFDPNNLLGKDAEEQLLIRDMRADAAQQIIRRLAALKPASAPAAN